jgi:hypothetical protein
VIRSIGVVVATVCGMSLIPAIPAQASTAPAVCAETNNVFFNPPLTLTNVAAGGVFAFNWSKTCVNTDGTVYSLAGTDTYPYAGTCLSATISTDVTVIGGVTYIALHKTGVLIPASGDPCNFTAGTYVGDKIDNI